jgi:hypothetical protein
MDCAFCGIVSLGANQKFPSELLPINKRTSRLHGCGGFSLLKKINIGNGKEIQPDYLRLQLLISSLSVNNS